MGGRSGGNAIAPKQIFGSGFRYSFHPHLGLWDASRAFDHQFRHLLCVAAPAEV